MSRLDQGAKQLKTGASVMRLPSRSVCGRSRFKRLGYALLFAPVHLFLIAVVIAAAVIWALFAWSQYTLNTMHYDWTPTYNAGPMETVWLAPEGDWDEAEMGGGGVFRTRTNTAI